jgi:hypothetical protein
MTVQLICPNLKCRKLLAVPEEHRGRNVKCQYCHMLLRVPEPNEKKLASAGKDDK